MVMLKSNNRDVNPPSAERTDHLRTSEQCCHVLAEVLNPYAVALSGQPFLRYRAHILRIKISFSPYALAFDLGVALLFAFALDFGAAR